MRGRHLPVALSALMLSTSLPTRAHEGGIDARGVVKTISDDGVTITTGRGDESFTLTPRTRFTSGTRAATRADLKVGDRVVVHAKRADAQPEAVEVKSAPRESGGGRE